MRQRRLAWVNEILLASLWIFPAMMLVSLMSGERSRELQRSKITGERISLTRDTPVQYEFVFLAEDYYDL